MSRILHHRFATLIAAGCALSGISGALHGAPIPHSLEHSFFSPSTARQVGTQLGFSVATEGAYVVIGSPHDDTGGEDCGIVGIYNAASGALLHTLTNPEPSDKGNFGWSVAISGTRVVIGVPQDDTGAEDTGIAYVYEISSPTPTVPAYTLENPHASENDSFGWSVAISGTRVVIGTPEGDSGISNAGRAYVYNLASGSPVVPLAQFNNPDPSGQNFGFAVSASATRVIVGAPQETGTGDLSRAYVYDFSSAVPAGPAVTLSDGTPANDQFGWAVSVSGSTLVVSAPQSDTGADNSGSAYVYNLGSGTPGVSTLTILNPVPFLNDAFGGSVSVSGTRIAIGNHLDDQGSILDSGRVFIFDLNSGTPATPSVVIDDPAPESEDFFGKSVALSGTRLATGAYGDNTGASNTGSVYLHEIPSGTLERAINTPSTSSDEEFGTGIALSGSVVVVGAHHDDKGTNTNSGTVFVYDFNSPAPGQTILTLENPFPATNDYFGAAVAVSGNTIVVAASQEDFPGAQNSGTVYVYNRTSPTPTVPVFTIPNPSPQLQDEFGTAIALSGQMLVIGASKNDVGGFADAGSAYLYDLSSGTSAVLVATFDNPAPAAGDEFGYAVAISGNKVAVGAFGNDVGGADDAGSVYIYDIPTGTAPVFTLNNPAPAVDDSFGFAVGISASYVVVGCPNNDTGEQNAGSAYAYNLSSGTPEAPVFTLENPGPEPKDFFGSSIALAGSRVVVGAPGYDFGAADAGAAFVYELSSATATVPADSLDNLDHRPGDTFGDFVAIDGTNILVAAPLDDGSTIGRGAAYVFDPDPPLPQMQVEQPPGTGLIGGTGNISFGNAPVGVQGGTQTVVVRNIGTAPLVLTGLGLVSGHTADFSFEAVSLPLTLPVDQIVAFDVSFDPIVTGSRLATLRITSNAGTNNPFNITLTGQALSAENDTDGDGLNDVVELQLEAFGFSWQVNDEELVAILLSGANATGLYTGSQLQAMHPGTPLLPVGQGSGQFTVTVGVKTSVDLMDFQLVPMSSGQTSINGQGALEFDFISPASKAFFRLDQR